ncbi:MAG: sodium-translocating pyrophosphatase [Chloroflexi bacterium]|nr:sodium-translocating pyrophosphatase [Chloroflexota bacterium]MBP8056320.1 sodium-translocating pyrophosphatase [Chloroflexota bacterium]
MSDLNSFENIAIYTVLGIAILGLAYAVFLRQQILREDKGTAKMLEVWGWIKDGANAYLSKQLRSILPLIAVLTIALFFSVYIVPPSAEAIEHFKGSTEDQVRLYIGIWRAVAFIMGAGFSLTVGQIGMRMAVEANVRVAAESRKSFSGALRIAYRAGTITGMLTDGLGLFGGTIIFIFLGKAAPDALLGFGFGGTLLALFMRVGGGIFTKAADVGADLVGKVESNLEEDDPRNAAVIADLVGDNVGDCAGMAADIFESYEVTIVSGLILGLALTALTGHSEWIVFPLIVRGIGVLSSIIGTYIVKTPEKEAMGDAMGAIFRGFLSSAAISVVLFALAGWYYMGVLAGDNPVPGGWWRPVLAVAVGVGLAILIDRVTEYFTGTHGKPVKDIVRSMGGGPATTILSGLVQGYESAVWSVLVIAGTIFSSILIFSGVGEEGQQTAYILYGVALTGIGMLTLTGNNVAMDSFGPISDNASGIGEMAGMDEKARRIMTELDAVGNTTKAITKGVAIGSAVIAAVSLFGSYITDVSKVDPLALADGIRISEPIVFIGMLLGGALPWMFSSLAINAVNRAARLIVNEVRRQFKAGVLERKIAPDYRQAVEISTNAAQNELISLALLGVIPPIIVGLFLGVEALGGFLAGIIISGQLLAVFMSNAGGAWDNAKKVVEDEPKKPKENLGKNSERHKAAVVGDTVGDPLKDTAGPALNPMIKVVNLVSVIIAPIVVAQTEISVWTVVVGAVLLAGLAWAVRNSKRDVFSEGL